jgi:flagellar biosynthesis protein FlhF
MRIKSYFAGTVEAALDLARRELGEDAVLLNSRVAPAEARHLGHYEVVFGVENTALEEAAAGKTSAANPMAGNAAKPAWPAVPATGPSRSADPAAGVPAGALAEEVRELRHQVARLERLIRAQAAAGAATTGPRPAGEPAGGQAGRARPPLAHFLTVRGFDPDFAEDVAREVEALLAEWVSGGRQPSGRASRQRPDPVPEEGRAGVFRFGPGEVAGGVGQRGLVAEAMLAVLAARIRIDAGPSAGQVRRRVLAIAGPAGAGKTVTLAKLAAIHGLSRRLDVAILSADTIRIAAADQLRTYAAILGFPFELLETPRAFETALIAHANRDLILLDTPGWRAAQWSTDPDAAPWRQCLARHGEIETHLAVPATLGAVELRRTIEPFRAAGASRLILTHAEEVLAAGHFAPVAASGLPVSFLASGQSIPEDIEAASIARLLDLAFAADQPEPAGEGFIREEREPGQAAKAAAVAARELTHA